MAILVTGTNINNTGVSSIVKEKPVPMPLSIQYRKDENGNLIDPSTVIDFSGVTTLQGNNAFIATYYNNQSITGHLDLSSITKIKGLSSFSIGNYINSFSYMFANCTGITSIDLSNLTTLEGNSASYLCQGMFQDCTGITGNLDLSSLSSVNGNSTFMGMFQGCTGITSVDLSGLVNLNQGNNVCNYMFQNCTGLTSFDMSNLESWKGYWTFSHIFNGCTGLTEARFPKLKYIGQATGYWFQNCTNLITIDLSAVEEILGQMCMYHTFENCTSLKTLSFPSLKKVNPSQQYLSWRDMLKGCTDVTVHFPSNLESAISSWTEAQNGFSGTNTVILYDLPATE